MSMSSGTGATYVRLEGPTLPALAWNRDDDTPVCDTCVARECVLTLKDGKPVTLYITNERSNGSTTIGDVTSWGGHKVGTAWIGSWGYSGCVRVRQFDAIVQGIKCYGKFGDMQCATLRPRVRQS